MVEIYKSLNFNIFFKNNGKNQEKLINLKGNTSKFEIQDN